MRFIEQLNNYFNVFPVAPTYGSKEILLKFIDGEISKDREIYITQDKVITKKKVKKKWIEIEFTHSEFEHTIRNYKIVKNWAKMRFS